jgi:long-chain acyl-CoA synthetase
MTAHVWEASYPPGVQWGERIEKRIIQDVLDEGVRRWPDEVMCEFLDKKFTYREIDDMVDRAAKGLRGLGVGPGVHVGLFLPNTPHYIVMYFAILKAGGLIVNYSPLYAPREISHQIEDSQTDIMVTLNLAALYPQIGARLDDSRLQKIIVCAMPEILPFPKNLLFPLARKKDIAKVPDDSRHITFKELLRNDGAFEPAKVADPDNDVAVLQYTGGTTGVPKGAMLTHTNICSASEMTNRWTGVLLNEASEVVLGVLPFFHVYAMTVVMLGSIANGAKIVIHPRFDIDNVLRDIGRKKVTAFSAVPTIFNAIINHPDIAKYDLTSLKVCGSGAAPLPVEVLNKFEELTGCRIIEGYGLTETSPTVASNPAVGLRKAGSVGTPMPQTVIEIVDLDDPDKLLDPGEKGEICITGPQVMKGYWKNEEATKNALRGGRFHTGDIGYMDEDGFIFLVDRSKDMILSGGFNVFPRIIEEAIYEHQAVVEVTVIGIPDEYRGQAAKAFVVLKPGADLTLEELKDFLADKIGKHEIPAALDIRDDLPKTPVGKLSKKELYAEEEAKRAAAT